MINSEIMKSQFLKISFPIIFKFILLIGILSTNQAGAFIGGKLARKSQFPGVITFEEINCTASVISPRHILLAAHCVHAENVPSWSTGHRLKVLWGQELETMERFPVRILKVSVHPSWIKAIKENKDLSDAIILENVVDLAVIEIEESLPIPAANLRFTPVDKTELIIIGGFGLESNYSNSSSYRHKVASKKIHSFKKNTFRVLSQDANKKTLSIGAPGDSGGPVFVRSAQGMEIVGVNSYVLGWLELDENGKIKELYEIPSLDMVRLDNKTVQKWLHSLL